MPHPHPNSMNVDKQFSIIKGAFKMAEQLTNIEKDELTLAEQNIIEMLEELEILDYNEDKNVYEMMEW